MCICASAVACSAINENVVDVVHAVACIAVGALVQGALAFCNVHCAQQSNAVHQCTALCIPLLKASCCDFVGCGGALYLLDLSIVFGS